MDQVSERHYFTIIVRELNRMLEQLCREKGLIFLKGVYEAVVEPDEEFRLDSELTRDGAHFNYDGYGRIGSSMCRLLEGELKKDMLVLLLGDSITAGFPRYEPVLMGEGVGDEEHSFGYYLKKRFGCRVMNKGISGDVTSNMLGRLEGYLREEPDFAILQGGANDAFSSLGFGFGELTEEGAQQLAVEIFGNFEAMVLMCLEAGAKVAVVPVLPFFG